jgi:polyribonucleotide nucleotidyltransferase
VEVTGAQIDVDEEDGRGIVKIYATSGEQARDALDRINAIANPQLPEKGERYNATVVKTVDFGAFVSLTPGTDGLLHISELSKKAGRRLDHAEEAVDVGDTVLVEVKDVLDGGRKFKLEYVGERAERAEDGGDDREERGRGGRERGGRDRGERGRGERDRARGDRDRGERDRDRGDRGDRGEQDRGERDRGEQDRGERERGGSDRGGERRDEGGERTRTRTRSRSRERD